MCSIHVFLLFFGMIHKAGLVSPNLPHYSLCPPRSSVAPLYEGLYPSVFSLSKQLSLRCLRFALGGLNSIILHSLLSVAFFFYHSLKSLVSWSRSVGGGGGAILRGCVGARRPFLNKAIAPFSLTQGPSNGFFLSSTLIDYQHMCLSSVSTELTEGRIVMDLTSHDVTLYVPPRESICARYQLVLRTSNVSQHFVKEIVSYVCPIC